MPLPLEPPVRRLFSVRSVMWGTIFGCPLGGGIVMAINYRRLGRSAAARWAIIGSVLATGVVGVIAFIVPEEVPGLGLVVPQLIGMYFVAKSCQGEVIESHRKEGGGFSSQWAAVGIGLCCLLIVGTGFMAAAFMLPDDIGTRLAINANDDIYYSGSATEADARNLGEVLTGLGYFPSSDGASVAVSRSPQGVTISFVLADDVWNEEEAVSHFKGLGEEIADQGFGRPLVIELCNSYFQSKRTLSIR